MKEEKLKTKNLVAAIVYWIIKKKGLRVSIAQVMKVCQVKQKTLLKTLSILQKKLDLEDVRPKVKEETWETLFLKQEPR